jgi:arsenite-transporting ATPase
MQKIIFFLGKGGVGKSTISALTAIYLSELQTIELHSLDQAHNLGDLLGQKLDNNPKKIRPNLVASEVNLEIFKQNTFHNSKIL